MDINFSRYSILKGYETADIYLYPIYFVHVTVLKYKGNLAIEIMYFVKLDLVIRKIPSQ